MSTFSEMTRAHGSFDDDGSRAVSVRDLPILVALGLSVGLLLTVMGLLWSYKNQPGPATYAPSAWPAATTIPLDRHAPTLVLFAHPMCPCTRATLGELRAILPASAGVVAAHVLFAVPGSASDDWRRSDLWATASSLPGVRVQADPNGREAERFGAKTSGFAVLYRPNGTLAFQGGITAARGHAGDNDGRRRLAALLRDAAAPFARSAVFGCSLPSPRTRRHR